MSKNKQSITIGVDYRGYPLALGLAAFFQSEGWETTLVGADNPFERTFYPSIADEAITYFKKQKQQKMILICGSGIGMCMRANKYPDLRAVVAKDPDDAMMSREHNDANVLCLAGESTDLLTAQAIAVTFLTTDFDAEYREDRVKALDAAIPKA